MSKGYSLHIGLNEVDTRHYPGTPVLKAAVNDAVFWASFAQKEGYTTTSLHDSAATTDVVRQKLADYATILQPGDILLLTYAGHGGEIMNDKPSGFDDERYDQTWCLYDRQFLDDELYEAFEAFAEGTRILVVSDSCHSGTVTRAAEGFTNLSDALVQGLNRAAIARGMLSRKLPRTVERMIELESGATVYQPIQDKYRVKPQAVGVKASVKLLAACKDDEETLDGVNNGIFTEAFMALFQSETYKEATAEQLIDAIRERYFFPRPNFFQYGGIIESFDNGFPFTIAIPDAAKVSGYRKPDLKAGAALPSRKNPATEQGRPELKIPAVLIVETAAGVLTHKEGGPMMEILERKTRDQKDVLTVALPGILSEHGWIAAHALQLELAQNGIPAIIEPVLTLSPAQDERISREGDASNPDFIHEWPPSLQQDKMSIAWHLDDEHSQLSRAQKYIADHRPDAHIRIGHLDTGYIEGHVGLPAQLNKSLARSFISKEAPGQAIDKQGTGQDGHGLGTLVLLAGNKVPLTATFNTYEGYIGGVPFAEVVPMRVAETVVIFNSEQFCEAIAYAIETGCEVISMSMAGKPSRRMARAVNEAYEAGIVMVTAASNCWYKGPGALLPKCVMFPAAFERVIAATGAMYDHKPYDVAFIQQQRFNITTRYMQGSWGPASRMTRALAAYTPNTPWASTHYSFLRSGGGTSSATPQVAAAAALWIACHREALEQKGYYQPGSKWKKIEAVRHALYTSAAKQEVFGEWQKYYGNGILRAYDALQVPVKDIEEKEKAPEAESSFWGILETIGSFFKNRKLFRSGGALPEAEAMAMELLHLLQTDPQFYTLFSELDLDDPAAVSALLETKAFREQVMASPYASPYLKEVMVG